MRHQDCLLYVVQQNGDDSHQNVYRYSVWTTIPHE
jgi:hypothetical protein